MHPGLYKVVGDAYMSDALNAVHVMVAEVEWLDKGAESGLWAGCQCLVSPPGLKAVTEHQPWRRDLGCELLSQLIFGEKEKTEDAISFSLGAFRQILLVLLFLWARAGQLKREWKQMALFLSGPWWPSTPTGFCLCLARVITRSCDLLCSLVSGSPHSVPLTGPLR